MEPSKRLGAAWPEPIGGVALDLDGLLFDTEPLYFEAIQRVLARRGKVYRDEVRMQMMGRPGPVGMQLLVDAEGLSEDWQVLLAESDRWMHQFIDEGVSPMPGLARLIETIRGARIPFGVATSSRRALASEILRQAGLIDSLSFLICGEDVREGKPAPEIYLAAAERLSIPAANMLVLEDSANGATAGVRSGACTIAIPGPHSKAHAFPDVNRFVSRLDDEVILQFFS
jgi:pseudouridine 5'-phosphatase